MKDIKIVLVITYIVMLSSCNSDAVNHAEGEITSIDFSNGVSDTLLWDITQTVKDLTLVKLGTESSIVLGNIHGIKLSSSIIIGNTEKGVFLFNHRGDYLRELYKRGRGPEEFIIGSIMCFLHDTAVVIDDGLKSRKYYYTVGISSGTTGKIRRASGGRVNSLIPVNDTILAALTDNMAPGRDQLLSYSLILQDFSGNMLAEYDLGYDLGNSLGPGTLLKSETGIIASLPSGRFFLKLSDSAIDTIWENKGLRLAASPLTQGVYDQVVVRHIDQKKILMLKGELIVSQRSQSFRNWKVLMINKDRGIASVLKPYLFDKSIQLNLSMDDFKPDGYICKVLYPSFLLKITAMPGGTDFLELLMGDPEAEKITLEDNPYLLYGRIK